MHGSIAEPAGRSGKSGFRLTGPIVLVYLLAFFGTIAAANGALVYYALSTFSGEEEAHPYEHGLAYDKDIAAARTQATLNWKVTAHVAHGSQGQDIVDVTFRDAQSANVAGLAVTAALEFATDKQRDRHLRLSEVAPGHYRGSFAAESGLFDLTIDAERGGHAVFRSRNRISLD